MSFVDLKWQKSEKNGILDFLTNSNTYMGNRFVAQKKSFKQKMQGAKSFVAPPSTKRGDGKKKKELGLYLLPFKSYCLKNLNSLRK